VLLPDHHRQERVTPDAGGLPCSGLVLLLPGWVTSGREFSPTDTEEEIHMSRNAFLRSATVGLGLLGLAATMVAFAPRPSMAADNPQLTRSDEIEIRGTILSVDPNSRTVVLESPERDTLTYRAIDRVTNLGGLKPGMLVDVRYYRVRDYLIAKTTPEVTARANGLLADPAKAPGFSATEMKARLWSVSGIVVRTDMAAKKLDIVDPKGGLVHRTPWIKSAEGQAALATFKPGDKVTVVFSERIAFQITAVR
jgi:Cu/Ag efflux protein CusF